MGILRSPGGEIVNIPDEQVESATAAGYSPVGLGDAAQTTAAPESADRGVLGGINAGLTGALSGATLGLSDYALKGLLDRGQFDRLVSEREAHPIASGVGQVAGSVLPALVAPESLIGRAPSGALSRAVAPLIESGGAARVIGAGAIEGAVQNAGAYLSDTALGDRSLSAEGLFAALGAGGTFGAAGGAVALGIEKGTIAARRMFSRAAGTDKAAMEAEQAFRAHYDATVEANNATAELAKAKLAEARGVREQAALAKQRAGLKVAETKSAAPEIDATHARVAVEDEQLRTADGQPEPVPVDPPAPLTPERQKRGAELALMGDHEPTPENVARLLVEDDAIQAARGAGLPTSKAWDIGGAAYRQGSIDEAALSEAVAEHAAARDELERMLHSLEAPQIEPGVVPQTHGVPVGEFGAPGQRGYTPGEVKAPGQPSVMEAQTGEVTAIGRKKFAQGTAPETATPEGIGQPAPPNPEASSTNTLTGQLRSMQEQLDSGSQLGRLSAESPAREQYVVDKLTKRAEDAAHFRTKAVERNYAGSEMAAAERAANESATAGRTANGSADMDTFFANLTRPKTRDAYVAANIGRAMREEGSHAAALAKVEREWSAMSVHPLSVAKLEHELDAATERAAIATEPTERAAAEQEARTIEEHLSRVGARPGAVEDIAAFAATVTKYERASAKLTGELGPEAPLAAQEAAKAFRAAEDAADRKTLDRTTRAIDSSVDSQGRPKVVVQRVKGATSVPAAPTAAAASPVGRGTIRNFADLERVLGPAPLPPTSAEAIAAAKAEHGAADVALRRAKIAEGEAKIGSRKASDLASASRDTKPPVAPQPAAKASVLGSIATGVGVAGELGVPGVPKPHDIPVIGPLLSIYLKYRAIKAAAGRFTGRVAATGDSRAAALAARTKDKIVTAVDRSLGLVAETAPKARGSVVAAATVLGHRVFDDGEPDAKRGASAQELAAVRVREIANAVARPELVEAYVRKELRDVIDPDLIAAAEAHLMARFQYLNSVAPKAPAPNPYSQREWKPSAAAANDLAQRLAVIHDPEAAFINPTPAKVDTLRNAWSSLLQLAQQRLIERVGDIKHPVPYQQRLKNSLLFGVALDDSLDPRTIDLIQSSHASKAAAQPPTPPAQPTSSIASSTNLSSLYQTSSDRRAAQR